MVSEEEASPNVIFAAQDPSRALVISNVLRVDE